MSGLSAEDIQGMSAARDKWLHATYFAGDCYDEAALKEGVRWIYSMKKLPIPEAVVLDSPLAVVIEKNRIRKSSGLNHEKWAKLHGNAISNSIWQPIEHKMNGLLNTLSDTKKNETSFTPSFFVLVGRFAEFSDTWKIKDISESLMTQFIQYSTGRTPLRIDRAQYFINISEPFPDELLFFSRENLLRLAIDMIIYDYLAGKKYITDEWLNRLAEFLSSGCFLSIFSHEYALISRRPVFTVLNDKLELHCEGGPAIKWRDGTKLYYLNGINVPEVIAATPAESLDPELLVKTKNVEVRKEIIRKIGIERVVKKLKSSTIDAWNGYELIKFRLPNIRRPLVYLKMRNPSTGAAHLECVSPRVKTCLEALSWRVGGLEWKPEQLT